MVVNLIRLKNRKLIVQESKKIDVTLLEKDDIYTLE